MIPMRLAEIATITGGVLHGPDVLVEGAAYVDTRAAEPQGLYVAVVGERVDGHVYADGAHAVLGSRTTSVPTVVVDDVTVALGRLARAVVDRLGRPVLAVTGSQGKTGTKDLLAHVLAPTAVATRANNNNELGVPLTVLRADEATTHLVLEMGARGIGHLAYLCEIAPPTVSAVLNVGSAHVGEFGGVEAIAAAKGELVEALDDAGTAVLNADDPRVAAMASRTRGRVLTFGSGDGGADVSYSDVSLDALGRATFDLTAPDGDRVRVALRQTGAHQVANAAAAATMALAVGVPLATVAERLSTAEAASRWRMELTERADGLLVLNDSYNANPASMRAALDSLRALGAGREGARTIAVLGEMRELGPEHDAGHLEVGRAAAGVDVVVVVGEAADGIGEGARAAGVGEVIVTAGRDDALAWVRKNAGAGDVVLVKASRAAELDVLAAALLDPTGDRST
jgi:UDP-N-acetylmuramoyl-tripeptide--D-alanyl-D-alanine ligase